MTLGSGRGVWEVSLAGAQPVFYAGLPVARFSSAMVAA